MPTFIEETRLVWLIAGGIVLAWFLRSVIQRAPWVARQKALLGQLVYVALIVCVGLAVLGTVGVDVTSLLAGLGIGGLALALATKDLLGNVVAGFLLLGHRAFGPGDRVLVAGHEGVIEATDMRYTTLRNDDGDAVHVPNQILLMQTVLLRGRPQVGP